jgi:hypothetical protein
MHRFIAFLATLVAALALGVSPAAAETVTFTDYANDVLTSDTGVTAPDQTGIDVGSLTVALNDDRLLAKTTHRNLTNRNAWDRSRFYLYTTAESIRVSMPTYVVTNVGMEYTVQRTKTWWQVEHPSPNREVQCASRFRIRTDLDTMTLRIPRGCIGSPSRLHIGYVIDDFRTAAVDLYDDAGSTRWVTKG